MRILVSNDDGIDSPGIFALAEAMKTIGEVTVVAPSFEKSAAGHSITMQTPLRVIPFHKNGSFLGFAVDGTPADCVKMGMRNIMPEPPDIVVAGINNGSNTATNVIYSGTVSAAREAAIMDTPAIAVSMTSRKCENMKVAADTAVMFVQLVMKNGLPPGTLLNINVPDAPWSEIKEIRITRQGRSKWDDIYEKRQDPMGRDYFWLTGGLVDNDNDHDQDQFCIKNNIISVTPIHYDLTDYDTLRQMKEWDIGKISD